VDIVWQKELTTETIQNNPLLQHPKGYNLQSNLAMAAEEKSSTKYDSRLNMIRC
jgi:hypothetical protein